MEEKKKYIMPSLKLEYLEVPDIMNGSLYKGVFDWEYGCEDVLDW